MFFKRHLLDLRKLKNGLRRYMLDRLYLKLGMEPVPFEIALPMWGSKTTAFIVRLETGRNLFVRLYRPWQWKEAEKEKVVNELLASNGVGVPKLIDYCDMPKRYYSIISVEEFLQGKPLTPDNYTDSLSKTLSGHLSQMHGIRRDKAGDLNSKAHEKEVFPYLLHRVRNRLKRIKAHGILDISRDKPLIEKRLSCFRKAFDSLNEWNLTHDKIHGKNIILMPDENLVFIDFTTAQYSFLGKDLVTIHHHYCGDLPDRVQDFDELYFKHMKPEEKCLFEESEPFYHAWYHLSRCAENCNAAKKCFRAGEEFGETYKRRAEEEWNETLEIVSIACSPR